MSWFRKSEPNRGNNLEIGEDNVPEPIKEVKIELRYKIGEEIYYLNPETKERELAKVLGFGVEEESGIQYYHISTLEEPQKELKAYLKDIGKVYTEVKYTTTCVSVYYAGKEIKFIPGENCKEVDTLFDRNFVKVYFEGGKVQYYNDVSFKKEQSIVKCKQYKKDPSLLLGNYRFLDRIDDNVYNYYDEEKNGLYDGLVL
ncbi:hypothetical protein [Listeria phage LP-KV022]|uniref:Uncharacterized protein n=2 Tax=Homburgvirus LP110 TaxID=1921128 RepID=A0A5A4K4K0_9CAUD|nr:hypothetical protein LP110_041 [Listeria phage LP-110]AGI11544.1 hypothetical protein LP110_041 [Listeria phage LP-110]AWY07735.1 hypothetical protein [Listeria phage LP-KV022]